MPGNLHNTDPGTKVVHVKNAQAAIGLKDFHVGNLVCCAHVIPEIAISHEAGD
jgi:hypothetical protein